MYRDIERWEVKVQIPGNKTEPQCPFLDTLGQDLLGIVLTIDSIALPVHLLFCPKQGRHYTNKADLLIEDVSEVLICYSLGVHESRSNPQHNRVTR
jgi:hypothetical protein